MLSIILGLIVGFVSGYGVREWISRRRRAAAREEWLRRKREKLEKESLQMVSEA
jgi:hypothetical protein